MNRRLTALFAAFEALLVVAIGVGIPLAPLTVLWGAQFGFGVDWGAFWRASVDIWLIGHGVDVTVTLDPTTAAALGYPGAGDPFTITIAALGLGMLTLMLAVRAGRRVAETRYRALMAIGDELGQPRRLLAAFEDGRPQMHVEHVQALPVHVDIDPHAAARFPLVAREIALVGVGDRQPAEDDVAVALAA